MAVLSASLRCEDVDSEWRQLFDNESDGWQRGLTGNVIKWFCLKLCVDHLFDGDNVGGVQKGGRAVYVNGGVGRKS